MRFYFLPLEVSKEIKVFTNGYIKHSKCFSSFKDWWIDVKKNPVNTKIAIYELNIFNCQRLINFLNN